MTGVAITQDDDHEAGIFDAIGAVDVESVIRDRVVAIKTNDTWASESDTTAATRPETLRAVIRCLRQYGPREIVVTGGSGAGETPEIFRVSGLMDVVEAENVSFFDHNKEPFQEVTLDYEPQADVTGPQHSVMVNPRVFEYDTLVVVSLLKMHKIATVTLALKNVAMSYPAADYYGHPRGSYRRHHHFFDDMHSFIAAMAKRFPIQLAVTVGHPAMLATGPIGGHPVDTGITIASTDALAADVVGAKLLGFDVQGVRHLYEAARLGVGQGSLGEMEFPRLSMDDGVRRFTRAVYGNELSF